MSVRTYVCLYTQIQGTHMHRSVCAHPGYTWGCIHPTCTHSHIAVASFQVSTFSISHSPLRGMHVEAICDLYQEKEPSPHGPEGSTAHFEGNWAQLPWTLLYLWWGGQTLYRETDNGRVWQIQEWPCASNEVWWVESGYEAGGCESSSNHTRWLSMRTCSVCGARL